MVNSDARPPRWVSVLAVVAVLVAVLHVNDAGLRHGLPDTGSTGIPR